ncbi:hypothetical protein Fmac_027285 [Flemingia macrophylla]|uniref:Uncharacterized protein n=1 Tax=Flemingia macrophylla TaxID=520843 RepID=A0ABD1LHE7_9FABA
MALPLLRVPRIPLTNHPSFPSVTRRRATTPTAELQTALPSTGFQSPSVGVPSHKVTVHDRQRGLVHEFLVPEDQYILHTAESQNISLPFACRHEAVGFSSYLSVKISPYVCNALLILVLSAASVTCAIEICWVCDVIGTFLILVEEDALVGYALLCVGFPTSDVEVETQDEDEVYWLQFGRYFARGPVERDDYALELAMGDE